MIERIASSKEFKKNILGYTKKDEFEDCYITVDRQRIFFDEYKTVEIYSKKIRLGEIVLTDGEGNFLFTWGISEKDQRVYIKFLAENIYKAKNLLKVLFWNYGDKDYYLKLKSNNPLVKIVQTRRLGFKFIGGRGKEILLYRPKFEIKRIKEKDNDDSDRES